MKNRFVILLFLIILSGSSYANQQKGIELFEAELLEKAAEQFKLSLSNDTDKPKALLYLSKIAMRNNEVDDAEDFIEESVELAPNDAEIQFYYGIVNGRVAQEASIFTALGYAKKTRNAFAKAVSLEPSNINYRQALLGYHLAAPSIAGGDTDIALEQAKAIKALDLKQGLMALASVYTATEDQKAIDALYNSLPKQLVNDPDILIQKAFYHQGKENFSKAIDFFNKAAENAADIEEFQTSKFHAIYQVGRSSVLGKTNLDGGIQSLNLFLKKAPSDKSLPSPEWAKFRLANLIELQGNKKKARSLYKNLKKLTTDKNLIKAIKKAL